MNYRQEISSGIPLYGWKWKWLKIVNLKIIHPIHSKTYIFDSSFLNKNTTNSSFTRIIPKFYHFKLLQFQIINFNSQFFLFLSLNWWEIRCETSVIPVLLNLNDILLKSHKVETIPQILIFHSNKEVIYLVKEFSFIFYHLSKLC